MSSYVPTPSIRPSACSTAPSSTTTISRSLRALHKTYRPRTSDALAPLGLLPSPVPAELLSSVTAQPLRLCGLGKGVSHRGKHEQFGLQGTARYGLLSMACLRTASASNLLNSSTSSLVPNWLTSTLVCRPVGWPSTGAVMNPFSRSQPPISDRPYF